MAVVPTHPPYDLLLATGDAVALARPEVDPGMIREIFEGRMVPMTLDGLTRGMGMLK